MKTYILDEHTVGQLKKACIYASMFWDYKASLATAKAEEKLRKDISKDFVDLAKVLEPGK